MEKDFLKRGRFKKPLISTVPGGCAARNRGAE